jgi:hypothetical protein
VCDVIYALPGDERLRRAVLRERKVKGESKAEEEYLRKQEPPPISKTYSTRGFCIPTSIH